MVDKSRPTTPQTARATRAAPASQRGGAIGASNLVREHVQRRRNWKPRFLAFVHVALPSRLSAGPATRCPRSPRPIRPTGRCHGLDGLTQLVFAPCWTPRRETPRQKQNGPRRNELAEHEDDEDMLGPLHRRRASRTAKDRIDLPNAVNQAWRQTGSTSGEISQCLLLDLLSSPSFTPQDSATNRRSLFFSGWKPSLA